MSKKKLVNLTLFIVKEELENYKLAGCDREKLKILSDPELVQELLAYILSRIPNIYAAVTPEQLLEKCQNTGKSLEQRMRIETLIEGGIASILQKKIDRSYPSLTVCQN